VSLLIVPMFYVWFDDLNMWRMRVFSKADSRTGKTPSVDRPSPAPEPAP
jgi:hypothetical protein